MKAIILKGISGCGKTTYARGLQSQQPSTFCISKDQLREENPDLKEWEIENMQKSLIRTAAGSKLDIIIDNTHCNPLTLAKITEYVHGLGYEYEVVDVFKKMCNDMHVDDRVGLMHCISRNESRDKKVPQSVIHKMYLQAYGYVPNGVIVDIDGTLANLDHRLHYVRGFEKDWEKFFDEVDKDSVNVFVKHVVSSLKYNGFNIILCSGRPNTCEEKTIKRLVDNGIKYDHLLMRDSWDRRTDVIVKWEMYDKCLKENIIFGVIDDRTSVIEMRKSLGLNVLAVNGGNDF